MQPALYFCPHLLICTLTLLHCVCQAGFLTVLGDIPSSSQAPPLPWLFLTLRSSTRVICKACSAQTSVPTCYPAREAFPTDGYMRHCPAPSCLAALPVFSASIALRTFPCAVSSDMLIVGLSSLCCSAVRAGTSSPLLPCPQLLEQCPRRPVPAC